MFHHTTIDGRKYRWSEERRETGRPVTMEYFNEKSDRWRPLRNMDMRDLLCLVADRNERTMDALRAVLGARKALQTGDV